MSKKVLIVDSEMTLGENLRHNLELDGYTAVIEPDARYALVEARTFLPDLVIAGLDALQDHDGRFLPAFRKEFEAIPVLVLGSRCEDAYRVRGFRLGLDDFVLRTSSLSELHRRIDLLAHHSADRVTQTPRQMDAAIPIGHITVRPSARIVEVDGVEVSLRLKEFDVLLTLLAREGRVVSRLEFLREVWGFRTLVTTRTVDTTVGELRKKLEKDPANPKHILTVRKIGYRLVR